MENVCKLWKNANCGLADSLKFQKNVVCEDVRQSKISFDHNRDRH